MEKRVEDGGVGLWKKRESALLCDGMGFFLLVDG